MWANAIVLLFISLAYGEPGDQCFENDPLTDCNFIDAPLEAMLEPFNAVFGVWFFPIVWGLFLAILWLRTQNTMLVGIVGILVSTMISTFYEPARQIGIMLFLIAMGMVLFQVIRQKVEQPIS